MSATYRVNFCFFSLEEKLRFWGDLSLHMTSTVEPTCFAKNGKDSPEGGQPRRWTEGGQPRRLQQDPTEVARDLFPSVGLRRVFAILGFCLDRAALSVGSHVFL